MIPSTIDRVQEHTSGQINEDIRKKTEENIKSYALAGKDAINQRLKELDREWDIERMLEAQAASTVVGSSILGFLFNRKWFIVPAIVGGFLFQHSIQGWCPPVPLLRWLGFRTAAEIDQERYALKAARGDFDNVMDLEGGIVTDPEKGVSEIIDAVRAR